MRLEVLSWAPPCATDIAGAQPIAELEEDAQFIGLAINLATLDDKRPPDAPNEADWRLGRQRSLPRSVKRLEHVERVDDRLWRRCRLEGERFEEGRRDLANGRIAPK